jgi:acyl-lipid omega-6 desaturase (Delta-12 desaturase)
MDPKRLPSRRELLEALSPYARPSTPKGLAIFLSDYVQLLVGMLVVFFAPWLGVKVLASLVVGSKLANLITLGHDAAHNTLTASRRLNRVIALACFIPCLHNYRLWVWDHHQIHHPETNSEHYDSYTPFTKEEFDALPLWRQLFERVIRAPNFVGFGVHYMFDRMIKVRIWPSARVPSRYNRSAWRHFGAIVAYVVALSVTLTCAPLYAPVTLGQAWVLGGVLPLFMFACLTGGSLYLMHTHPRIRWHRDESARDGAYRTELEATNLTLPAPISMAAHHVFSHSVHHAHAGIPCYHIPAAQRRFDELMGTNAVVEPLSLRGTINTLNSCKLYDFETHTWLDFRGRPTTNVAP